jgi:hypothetical protein
MASGLRYLSGYNGYLPKETGEVIAFIRKPEEFRINDWCQFIETPADVFAWCQLSFDDSVRLVDDRDNAWEDGDPLPEGDNNKHRFQFLAGRTQRRAYPWRIGYKAIDLATWKPKLVHMDDAISIAMTARTNRVITAAEKVATWGANTAPANTINGGFGNWKNASDDPLSPNYNAIFKSLQNAAVQINLFTNAKVRPADMRLVISPELAAVMAQTPEINNYVRESPFSKEVAEHGYSRNEQLWNLPEYYKGFKIVVEDTPIVTEFPAAPDSTGAVAEAVKPNRAYAKNSTTAYLVSRPGGLDGEYGTKSFSTVQLYHYGALLETQMFDEPINRRVRGSVVEETFEVVAAPVSGFLITACQ